MKEYSFIEEYGEDHEILVLEDTGLQLDIQIDGEPYQIIADTGSQGKFTQRYVKKVMGPQMAVIQSLQHKAIQALEGDHKKRFDEIQKDFEEKKATITEDEKKAMDKELNEILDKHLTSDDLYQMNSRMYDQMDPDVQEKLDQRLFKKVQAVKVGNLSDPKKFDQHFYSPELMDHIDILRSVVIEFNGFLGSRDRKKKR